MSQAKHMPALSGIQSTYEELKLLIKLLSTKHHSCIQPTYEELKPNVLFPPFSPI